MSISSLPKREGRKKKKDKTKIIYHNRKRSIKYKNQYELFRWIQIL